MTIKNQERRNFTRMCQTVKISEAEMTKTLEGFKDEEYLQYREFGLHLKSKIYRDDGYIYNIEILNVETELIVFDGDILPHIPDTEKTRRDNFTALCKILKEKRGYMAIKLKLIGVKGKIDLKGGYTIELVSKDDEMIYTRYELHVTNNLPDKAKWSWHNTVILEV